MAGVQVVSAAESQVEEEGMLAVPVAVHPLEGVVRVRDVLYMQSHGASWVLCDCLDCCLFKSHFSSPISW